MKCGRSKNLEYLVDHRSRRGRHQKKKKKEIIVLYLGLQKEGWWPQKKRSQKRNELCMLTCSQLERRE